MPDTAPHRFTPVEAARYRQLKCAKYLHNVASGKPRDPVTELEVRTDVERAQRIEEIVAGFGRQAGTSVERAEVRLRHGDAHAALTAAMAGRARVLFTHALLQPSTIPGGAFVNIADFTTDLLDVTQTEGGLALSVVGFGHGMNVTVKTRLMLAVTSHVLDGLLPREEAGVAVSLHVLLTPRYDPAAATLPDLEDLMTPVDASMYRTFTHSFCESAHETYPRQVAQWYIKAGCAKCPYEPSCKQDARGTLKQLKLFDLAKLSRELGIDTNDPEGLQKLLALWQQRDQESPVAAMMAACLTTDVASGYPPRLQAAIEERPVLKESAWTFHLSKERPDVEIVLSLTTYEEKVAAWACVFDAASGEGEGEGDGYTHHDLGCSRVDVANNLNHLLGLFVGQTVQLYCGTARQKRALANWCGSVSAEDAVREEDRKYPWLHMLSEFFLADLYGGMDVFKEDVLTLKGSDDKPLGKSFTRYRKINSWLRIVQALRVDIPLSEKKARDLGTVANVVLYLCKEIGLQCRLPYGSDSSVADVLAFLVQKCSEAALASEYLVSLESVLTDLYSFPGSSGVDSVDFALCGFPIHSSDDMTLVLDRSEDEMRALHKENAEAMARLLASPLLRGARCDTENVFNDAPESVQSKWGGWGEEAVPTATYPFTALAVNNAFPFQEILDADSLPAAIRYVAQRGLKKQLASNKTGELLTVRLDEITPITPEGHRTGVLRIIAHGEKLMKKTTSGGNLVLEQLGRGRAAYFNEFAYLSSTLQSRAWWKLENLAVADYLSTSHTDADHEKYNQELAAVLQVEGTDVKIGVWNKTKTMWLRPGTIMTIRQRLFESGPHFTAMALADAKQANRLSNLLSDPEGTNRDQPKFPVYDWRSVSARISHTLFGQQQQLVWNACNNILSVVCGPPGTGKTVGIAHAVAEIMRYMIRSGTVTDKRFHVFVTAANTKPIRTLLDQIASLTSDLKELVVCEASGGSRRNRGDFRLYNDVCLDDVFHLVSCNQNGKILGMPNFCVVGMLQSRFTRFGTEFACAYRANSDVSEYNNEVNAKYSLVPERIFQMGVIDEGSQLLCQDFPPILNRLHTRGRLVVAGDPLQLQPFATRKARISSAFIDRVGLPLHDSLLLCLLRRREASHTVSLAADPKSRFYKEEATFAVLDKADCKVAMKESYVTKLTACLRSHPDVASLTQGLYEEHVRAQPAACFDRWLRHKPAPLLPPATEEEMEKEVTFTCVLSADDDEEEETAVGETSSCEIDLIPSMFRRLFKDGSVLGGQTVGSERLVGGLLVIELDMDAAGMMSQRAYTQMTSALALSMVDALQRNFRTNEDKSPSALLLYTSGPVDVPTRCRMQEGRDLRVGTPESLQGQSADVVVVTTGLPTQGARDRYFCNLTEMNVAFSRALHLQVLIVPKVLHLNEDALQDRDTSEGLAHIDAFRQHAKATTVRFVVSASLDEGVGVNSRQHTYPQRPQEDFVHNEAHLPAGRSQPEPFKTDMQFRQSPDEPHGGKGGGQSSKGRKGEKGDGSGKGNKGSKGGKGEKGAQQPNNDDEDYSPSKGKGKGGRGGSGKQGGKGKARQPETWGSFLGEDAGEGDERRGPPKPAAAMTSWRANDAAEGPAPGSEDTPQPGKGSRRGKSAKGGGGGGRGGGKGGKKRSQQQEETGSSV
eukprot:Rhum_TRINITY_DN15168_c1_g1::Rhum_TRINITY_DN15168_c1_g1_i6::g.141069::m.141069